MQVQCGPCLTLHNQQLCSWKYANSKKSYTFSTLQRSSYTAVVGNLHPVHLQVIFLTKKYFLIWMDQLMMTHRNKTQGNQGWRIVWLYLPVVAFSSTKVFQIKGISQDVSFQISLSNPQRLLPLWKLFILLDLQYLISSTVSRFILQIKQILLLFQCW